MAQDLVKLIKKTVKLYDDMIKNDMMSDVPDSFTKIDNGLWDITTLVESMQQAKDGTELREMCAEVNKMIIAVNKEYLAFLKLSEKFKEDAGATISGLVRGIKEIKKEADNIM